MAAVARVGVELDSRGAISGLRGLDAQARKTQGAFTGLKNAALAVGSAAAAIKGAQFVFAKTAELETQTRSLKVLTGSLQDAQKVIKELQDFGAVTPFTSSELIETAKRLKAFGFETENIVDVTKRLGDIAGATGADLGGIATAFGQIQAKGRLQGEELLQLQERGVDLQGTLRKEYGLTADEFQKALSKGQIGADAVNFALEKLTNTGGKYADGAIAQSDTLSGKLSTLQDGIDNLARRIGQVLSPVIKGVFDQAIATLDVINRMLAAGRGGGFNRAIGKIGSTITFGATSQGIDDVEKFLGQISSQKNKAGIEQNIQALTQLSNALKRIPATDPNAGRLEGLQGRIMQMQNQNLAALQNIPAQTLPDVKIPELGGGAGGAGGAGKAARGSKERVDASQKLLDLNRELLGGTRELSELEKINLEFQIAKQEILDRGLTANNEEIALLKAQAGFESDLLGFRQEQLDLQQRAADVAERERKKREADEKRRREADPGFQMKQKLEELLDVQNQVAAGATVIGNAFAGAFKGVITGSKSAEDALKDMLAATAEHFLDMAMQIIAQQITMILYGTIMKALGITMPGVGGGGGFGSGASAPLTSGLDFSSAFAEGGYVSGPTNALIGEGGEPEYVIPESKMRESMSRYSRGARGGSVIPESGSDTSAEGGGTAVAAPIDVRYTVERINSVDYVTADQFQAGLRQAADQGAKQGEQKTLKRLQMSSGTRKRLGM